jgi:NADH dehydrogenase/NADH:ubiquinone oxidoreductase subunit G
LASELDSLASKTGFSTDDYLDAAYVFAASERPVILFKGGKELSILRELALVTNSKLISVKGGANSLTAAQLKLEKTLSANERQMMFLAVGDGDVSQKATKEFEKAPFKVVQATYASTLTGMADVVLPSTNWLEQEGHYLNLEGHVQLAKRSLTSTEEILSPFQMLGLLAEKLDIKLSDSWSKEIHKRKSSVEITN